MLISESIEATPINQFYAHATCVCVCVYPWTWPSTYVAASWHLYDRSNKAVAVWKKNTSSWCVNDSHSLRYSLQDH